MFSPENSPVLYDEAISGARIAIEILFTLLNVSDGGDTKLLETDLGWIARIMPRLFLEILAKYKDTKHIQIFGYPVSFVGIGHNAHVKAAIHILKKRMEALSSVKDPKYAEIKEACIRQIKAAITERYK